MLIFAPDNFPFSAVSRNCPSDETIGMPLHLDCTIFLYFAFVLSFFFVDLFWISSDELHTPGVKSGTASDYRRCTKRKDKKLESFIKDLVPETPMYPEISYTVSSGRNFYLCKPSSFQDHKLPTFDYNKASLANSKALTNSIKPIAWTFLLTDEKQIKNHYSGGMATLPNGENQFNREAKVIVFISEMEVISQRGMTPAPRQGRAKSIVSPNLSTDSNTSVRSDRVFPRAAPRRAYELLNLRDYGSIQMRRCQTDRGDRHKSGQNECNGAAPIVRCHGAQCNAGRAYCGWGGGGLSARLDTRIIGGIDVAVYQTSPPTSPF
ncbi:hypothetical protein J6590_013408 [Homalodisca vitripennis]|nr:hypothetical protein J6590_013408 [Homalodisca vitripennis]